MIDLIKNRIQREIGQERRTYEKNSFTETEMEDREKVKEKISVWLKETGSR